MPKMRVHEVAKLFSKSSKEIIAVLKQQGIDVQSHMSTVTEENIEKLKPVFGHSEKKVQEQPKQAPAKAPQSQETAAKEQPKQREENRVKDNR